MTTFTLCTVLEFAIAFGMAGLFWPERLMPVFQILMFPWTATHRGIRANSALVVALSLVFFAVASRS